MEQRVARVDDPQAVAFDDPSDLRVAEPVDRRHGVERKWARDVARPGSDDAKLERHGAECLFRVRGEFKVGSGPVSGYGPENRRAVAERTR